MSGDDQGGAALTGGRLDRLRSRLGASAALWAGPAGVTVGPDGWWAISGARSVDYNVILCHGHDAGPALTAAIHRLGARTPGVVMVAGAALADVQTLVAAGWVCIGATPLMYRALHPAPGGYGAGRSRRLEGDALAEARGLIEEVFELGPGLAEVALSADAERSVDEAVWGLSGDGRLAACLAAVRCQDTVAIWSMATARHAQRRGYGATLLTDVMADAAAGGAVECILYASAAGEPFYRAQGFVELERWQMWSRPRWVLGRA